jgi:hypothetical protein
MMKIQSIYCFAVLFLGLNLTNAQEKKYQMHTIAFYNVENFFDTEDDPEKNDDVKLPDWYEQKLKNLERVISDIGKSDMHANSPVILGVCEVENLRVLEDLVKMPKLANKGYKIIHYESPDGRGIDVGLLYQEKHFKPTSHASIPLRVRRLDNPEKWLRSRDQLLVTGLLDGEEVHFIVNHWPSRSGGEKRSSPYREAAGALNRVIIDSLQKINPDAKIITMGDLNDGPNNKSVKKALGTVAFKKDITPKLMFNPMEEMSKKGIGSLAYRESWDLFDQIILSEPLVRQNPTGWFFYKAWVFNKPYLIQVTGQYKGYPLRNTDAVPGFSDHFPVYVYLIREHK